MYDAEIRSRFGALTQGLITRVPRFILLLAVSMAAAAEPAKVTVTDLSGDRSSGTLKVWDRDRIVVEAMPDAEFSRTAVSSIAFDHSPQTTTTKATCSIWLSNGDRISAKAVSAADDTLTILWPVTVEGISAKIPLERVVAVILEMPATKSDSLRLFADLDTLPAGSDLLMLTNGDRSLGEFERMDAAFVQLKVGKTSLKLDRSRVRAIRLNPELINVTRATGRRVLLTMNDGSRLTANGIELKNETITLKTACLGDVSLPVNAIATCHFFGERVIPVTDYEPVSIEFTPYLSTKWSLVRNANVLHGPLLIRGVEFPTGLGTHSRMAVTYELRGDEQEFQSSIGVDDAANGSGSVIFAIDIDGRRVWTSAEITGKSPVMNVPKNALHRSKRLRLLVDYGQFGDVSDYADWCDPIFVLSNPR